METSTMIGIYHSNEMKYHPKRKAWQNARRCGLETKVYKNNTCNHVFKVTIKSLKLISIKGRKGIKKQLVANTISKISN